MRTKQKQGQSLDTTCGQRLNKMRTTPQIQVEEQNLTLKKRPRSKHWQTECRPQRVKENNRTQ